GVEVLVVRGGTQADRARAALDQLGEREVQSVVLEGGPRLAGAFFDAEEIDEVRAFVAPILAGGREARTPVEGFGAESIGDCRRAVASQVERIDDDLLITARFREW
ncbi:MAG: dihydrofolate reductase family protein, partial [Actinomycetota bacterium]|nr:dihydrofolate reductase family protein [Actinomycetota bacterium]